jgi:hypothetical protein
MGGIGGQQNVRSDERRPSLCRWRAETWIVAPALVRNGSLDLHRCVTLLRLIVTGLFLGNAVSAGVCAMLCDAKVCCPAHSAPKAGKAEKPCCPLCKPRLTQAITSVTAPPTDDCCAWIGKKIEPPASLVHALTLISDGLVAVLPCGLVLPAPALAGAPIQAILHEDRAPPGGACSPTRSRAPPIV